MRVTDSRGFLIRVLEGSAGGVVPALTRGGLFPLSLISAGALKSRRLAYKAGLLRAEKLPAPTISVGNLTVGGTGKTPLVEWLVRWLQQQGRRPAILSRGYGAAKEEKVPGTFIKNDERLLLERALPGVPHYAAPDRVKAAREAIAAGADCLVLDDGFQHLQVTRDVNLALIDALNPFGGGRVLPGGFLREPLGALRAADAVILTRADAISGEERRELRQRIADIVGTRPILEALHRPRRLTLPDGSEAEPATALASRSVYAFCAIGNPWGFVKTLEGLGAVITDTHFFRDHFAYGNRELARVVEDCERTGAEYAVTTTKDAVKLGSRWKGSTPLRVLPVAFEFTTGVDELEKLLKAALAR